MSPISSPSDQKPLSTQFFHSQFSIINPHYVPDSASPTSPQSASNPIPTAQKKKHVCPTCDRPFTTSGHLARHSRVHTGERNHKCPFPGCETRCSRQDNLQQHYRIHLSPGSRRSSTRSAIARAMNGTVPPSSGLNRRASTSSTSPTSPPSVSSLLSPPPPLEPARVYALSTPPDSPPQLAQATLPATAHPPPESASSRSSSSPHSPYSSVSHDHHQQHNQAVPIYSQPINISGHQQHPQTYSHYRSGTTTYQEQSQGTGITYVHTTPISHSAPGSGIHGLHHTHNSYSYSDSRYDNRHLAHNLNNQNSPSPPTPNAPSRHSISHISHPHPRPYPQHHISDPPSPSSSPTGPTTPSSYPVFQDDAHYQRNGIIMDHSSAEPQKLSTTHHFNSQGQMVHSTYSPPLPLLSAPISSAPASHNNMSGRFDSPPPTLAPIQDERVMRGDSRLGSSLGLQGSHPHQHHHSHSAPSYLHLPQPVPTDYPYHQAMGLGHGPGHGHNAWKVDGGIRSKGVGALVQ